MRKWIVILVTLAVVGGALLWRLRKPPGWENDGDFAGPLARGIKPFNPALKPSRPWLDHERSTHPPAVYRTYYASTIDQATDYLVYLPPGYDDPAVSSRRYPVIYWLHGFGAQPHHGAGFIEGLDVAIRAGKCPPVIAILPNGLVDSWYVDSGDGSQPVESVFIRDLIPHVDSTYRTIATRDARAIEGFSMGGWGAAHLAFKYPQVFGQVTMVGTPIHTPASFKRWHLDQYRKHFGENPANFYAEDPVTRARRRDADAPRPRIRFLIGTKDGNIGWSRAFDKRLRPWGYESSFIEVPGVEHSDAEVYDKLDAEAFDAYAKWFKGL